MKLGKKSKFNLEEEEDEGEDGFGFGGLGGERDDFEDEILPFDEDYDGQATEGMWILGFGYEHFADNVVLISRN